MADQGERTEQASGRRLQKAREEGQFPNSKEFVGAFQFVAFIVLITRYGSNWYVDTVQSCRLMLQRAFVPNAGVGDVLDWFTFLITRIFLPIAIGFAVIMALTLSLQLTITRGGISMKKLTPDFAKFNPVSKFKEIFKQCGPAVLKAVLMLCLFSGMVYALVLNNVGHLFLLPQVRLVSGIHKVWELIQEMLWRAAGIFVFFGFVDLIRQKRRFKNDLKMSKQELKEELKDSEGSPQIKQRIRRLQRDLRRRSMMKDVPTATAVVVNPTHYAVAIRYQHETMATPLVVAKGKNYLALRIRAIAVENQVPLVENPPLAQALYKSVEVGQEIPLHLYRAVAEILAYIYRLMNARPSRGAR